MLRKVEITGVHQKTLETIYKQKIHECNAAIKMINNKLANWDAVPDKIKERYTKEEYKKSFLDYQLARRRDYIYKLRDIRNGYIYE